uniref:Uncharacterized protein n=1 Tax=Equus caballus TaxID=9796 RepID=A0A3Q2GVW7_HORSE
AAPQACGQASACMDSSPLHSSLISSFLFIRIGSTRSAQCMLCMVMINPKVSCAKKISMNPGTKLTGYHSVSVNYYKLKKRASF